LHLLNFTGFLLKGRKGQIVVLGLKFGNISN
jgi:hypothetical protein